MHDISWVMKAWLSKVWLPTVTALQAKYVYRDCWDERLGKKSRVSISFNYLALIRSRFGIWKSLNFTHLRAFTGNISLSLPCDVVNQWSELIKYIRTILRLFLERANNYTDYENKSIKLYLSFVLSICKLMVPTHLGRSAYLTYVITVRLMITLARTWNEQHDYCSLDYIGSHSSRNI